MAPNVDARYTLGTLQQLEGDSASSLNIQPEHDVVIRCDPWAIPA